MSFGTRFGYTGLIEDLEQKVLLDEANNAGAVGRQLGALRQHLGDLSLTVEILIAMLAEAKALDPEVLIARIEAELGDRRAATSSSVVCVRCGATRPASATVITAEGATCDPACASTSGR